jgi:hypothetical protein
MRNVIAALVFAAVIASPCAASAGDQTPSVDTRQENQDRRIDQGVASGELTAAETARLEAQQNRIERREARFKSDGTVTRSERARLHNSQNAASRNIRRQKHDRQDRN